MSVMGETDNGDDVDDDEDGAGAGVKTEAEDMFPCVICDEELPRSDFPQRGGKKSGSVCIMDDIAVEGLQARLKGTWKDEYKARWKALKKDKEGFKREVLKFRIENPSKGRGHRKLKCNMQELEKRVGKYKRTTRGRIRKPFTWPAFLEHFQCVAGGSHTKTQSMDHWKTMGSDGTKSDDKGVYQGKSGQLRYWIPAEEEERSESGSEEVSSFIQKGKGAKRLKELDVEDFMDGTATLGVDDTMAEAVIDRKMKVPRVGGEHTGASSSQASAVEPKPARATTPVPSPGPKASKPVDALTLEKTSTTWTNYSEDRQARAHQHHCSCAPVGIMVRRRQDTTPRRHHSWRCLRGGGRGGCGLLDVSRSGVFQGRVLSPSKIGLQSWRRSE
jgi:hypothetical protein